MILHLIRHGQTLANQQRLYCGSSDLPLCAEGIKALQEQAAKGIYPAPEGLVLCSSGLLRAKQSLQILYPGLPQQALPGFAEMDFGDFELKSYEQLKGDPSYQAWIEDEGGQVACPGGESGQAFAKRVLQAFDLLCSKGQDALLLSHGGVIVRLMQHLFPQEPRHFYQWQPRLGEGYTLHRAPDQAWTFRVISA